MFWVVDGGATGEIGRVCGRAWASSRGMFWFDVVGTFEMFSWWMVCLASLSRSSVSGAFCRHREVGILGIFWNRVVWLEEEEEEG